MGPMFMRTTLLLLLIKLITQFRPFLILPRYHFALDKNIDANYGEEWQWPYEKQQKSRSDSEEVSTPFL